MILGFLGVSFMRYDVISKIMNNIPGIVKSSSVLRYVCL